jgi:hypothetical protein
MNGRDRVAGFRKHLWVLLLLLFNVRFVDAHILRRRLEAISFRSQTLDVAMRRSTDLCDNRRHAGGSLYVRVNNYSGRVARWRLVAIICKALELVWVLFCVREKTELT